MPIIGYEKLRASIKRLKATVVVTILDIILVNITEKQIIKNKLTCPNSAEIRDKTPNSSIVSTFPNAKVAAHSSKALQLTPCFSPYFKSSPPTITINIQPTIAGKILPKLGILGQIPIIIQYKTTIRKITNVETVLKFQRNSCDPSEK